MGERDDDDDDDGDDECGGRWERWIWDLRREGVKR